MVLGLRSKTRKKNSVEVEYNVHVLDIKPWPSTISLESLLLHWENGDQSSGILTSGVEDGKIEFNESFRLTVNLIKEGKSKSQVSFQKNHIEFHLHETRKDMTIKGQLLGSAKVNIAEYGVMKETTSIYIPLNCTKKFRSTVYQPVLFIKVEPYDVRDSSSSLTNASFVDEALSEENYEDTEIASITSDDVDIRSHSSRISSDYESSESLISQKEKSGSVSAKNKMGMVNEQASTGKQISLRSDTLPVKRTAVATLGRKLTSNNLQPLKSVQFPFDSTKNNILTSSTLKDEKPALDNGQCSNTSTSNSVVHKKEKKRDSDGSKVELRSKIQMLEEELREAAAIEIGLYSILAEHGSSVNKVHAPARRLSRFYLHASDANSLANQAKAARAVVSGLVMVSKASGNDVPRLAFWLSNAVVLRVIVSKAVEELPLSTGHLVNGNDGDATVNKKSWLTKNKLFPNMEDKNNTEESLDNWEDPHTLTVALENIEAWIFSRVVESIWWQTLTPHMQSTTANGNTRKANTRRNVLNDHDQMNFSIDIWKKAFKDACERLCPIRAGGHECGCLPALSRLVMEQLVNRLDVAMFNAILRESPEEMPTDPISDPISDSKVLPISVGKSSFGAGVQLKNAVGNWSRWLTDLFGIDDDSNEDESNLQDGNIPEIDTSFKAFHLLRALSDLMMLPWEMLADKSTRIEVCPTFGSSLIKRVLDNFVPDEFCPGPVPASIFYALDAEDDIEAECISSFPVTARPPVYMPPSSASLVGFIGEVGSNKAFSRSGSLLKKSYTSDDELDELDFPISSIINGNSAISPMPDWKPASKGGRSVVRYKLLREIWATEK